jgi:hypothetical protein
MNPAPCQLCLSHGCVNAGRNSGRDLICCPACGLVFVPESQWPSVDDERARYAHHDNTPANEGYVRFLGEVADVVCGLVGKGARILDFGSGQAAVLTALLRERGWDCTAYDPLYGIGPDALAGKYDVIVLCEVIEHLRDLRSELARVTGCLRAGGHVVVRTRCYPSLAELPSWWYARDPSHINFFAARTLGAAARLGGLRSGQADAPDIFVWSTSR